MTIESVTVGGFKNVKESTIHFQHPVMALVSENNYGKSNLLEAIRFGIIFINALPEQRKAMLSFSRYIPITIVSEADDYVFEIEFSDPSISYSSVRYGYRAVWLKDDGSGLRIKDEWLDVLSDSNRWIHLLKFEEGKYRRSEATQSYRVIKVRPLALLLDTLSMLQSNDAIVLLAQSIQNIDYRICASLDVRAGFTPPVIEYMSDISMDEAISFDDVDIPRAIYRLKSKDQNAYQHFINAAMTVFPEFEEFSVQAYSPEGAIKLKEESDLVPFRIRDEMYRVVVKSTYLNQPVNITAMSTGTKRVLWALLNACVAGSAGINLIAIEELETSIHPRLLRILLELLYELVEDTNTKIIISSHSSHLLQYLKTDSIYVGMPNKAGTAKFARISHPKSLEVVSRDYGMTSGEYLFELMSDDCNASRSLSYYLEGDE